MLDSMLGAFFMPVLDPQKQHPSVSLRLPREDRIAYYLIGDRQPIGHEIPTLLQSPLLGMLPFLPKSGLQYLDPIRYQQDHVRRNEAQYLRFGVVFSDNFPEWADQLISEPCFLRVFLWHTKSSACVVKLMQLAQDKVVLVPGPNWARMLLKLGVPRRDLLVNVTELYKRIEQALLKKSLVPADVYARQRQKAAALAETYHEKFYPRKFLPFSPLKINVAQLGQMFGNFGTNDWEEISNDRRQRAPALAASFNGVSHASAFIRYASIPKITSRPPSAILTFPSISPILFRHWTRLARKAPVKLRKFAQVIASARIAEQDSTDYLNRVKAQTTNEIKFAALAGAHQLAAYSHFFDTVGYLHASFETSPYLRAPIKGGSLAAQHRFFSPGHFRRNPPSDEICRRVYEFGDALARAIHPEIRKSLRDYDGGVIAMTDLPLEWMDLEGVPLCFAKDLCRMPEGLATNLLAQFARNSSTRFVVTPEIVKRTLVVCGAPDGDPVTENFRLLQKFHEKQSEPRPHFQRCTSLTAFYQIVDEFRPEFLVIDSHGRFVNNSTGTEITFGNENLNGREVIRNLPQIPLVFLSACWGAPLYGCPNTIAHAFFETGSFAVTTSLLPVGVQRGSVLYTRLLRNLVMAGVNPLHPHWSSFVSHTVRTSYLSDLVALVRHRLGNVPDTKNWVNTSAKWFRETMVPNTRDAAFRRAKEIVAEGYGPDLAPAVLEILSSRAYLPEFMFYSTMGRADLIKFAAWDEKHHAPGRDAVTIREVEARAKTSGGYM